MIIFFRRRFQKLPWLVASPHAADPEAIVAIVRNDVLQSLLDVAFLSPLQHVCKLSHSADQFDVELDGDLFVKNTGAL